MPQPGTVATLTIQLQVTGDGRRDIVTRTPTTPSTFSSFAPPGGLSNNAPLIQERYQLQAGNNTVLQASVQPQGYPAYYFIMVPPVNSTNGKALKGDNTDVGNALNPAWPLVYALPQANQASSWPTLIIQSQGAETIDTYIV
jgi:hypothetical protein